MKNSSRKERQGQIFEARISKQIQMTKIHNVPNNLNSDSSFWICTRLLLFGRGLFRSAGPLSIFEFRIYFAGRLAR
jgi:hypothetical protein